jgi:DNA-binding transcriptional ArsR family regulator
MLRSKEAEMAYLTLRSDTAQRVFAFIVNNPGCYQEKMAEAIGVHHDTIRWHVTRMAEVGLIKVKRQGRKKIHFLDTLGENVLKGSLNTITETFVFFLMEKLEDACLAPEVRESTPDHITIRIDCPEKGKDCFITINLTEWQFEYVEEDDIDTLTSSEEVQVHGA